MKTKDNVFIISMGYVTLFMSGVFFFLFLMNLRSRIHYHGPNYGFLLWIFVYSAITGVGLMRLKKWAVISLFVPGILYAAILVFGYEIFKQGFPVLAVLFNIALLAILVAIPLRMLPHWHRLHW